MIVPRDRFGSMRHRKFATVFSRRLAILAFAGFPLLSGCVGSAVNETLDTAALNAPAQFASESETLNVEYTALQSVPLPVRSPLEGAAPVSQLSLAETTVNPVEQAAADLIVDSQDGTDEPTMLLETAGASIDATGIDDEGDPLIETADSGVSIATNASAPTLTASPAQSRVPAQVQTHAQAPARAGQQKTQPPSLFAALFAPRPNKPVAQQAPTVSTTPGQAASVARPSASNDLPGVTRDSALFGISQDGPLKKQELVPSDSVQVASIGSFGRYSMVNGLVLQTDSVKVDCFTPELMRILRIVERRYGKKVMVTSGFRSASSNRRAGGARNSTHIYCKAADIQVDGVAKWDLAKFLRTVDGRGGVGTYCRTESVHIDVGSVRDWHYPCRRNKSRVKSKKA